METVLLPLAKKPFMAKTSNLPVVKKIQKALHQKFDVTWFFRMKKKRLAFSANIGSFDVRAKNTF